MFACRHQHVAQHRLGRLPAPAHAKDDQAVLDPLPGEDNVAVGGVVFGPAVNGTRPLFVTQLFTS